MVEKFPTIKSTSPSSAYSIAFDTQPIGNAPSDPFGEAWDREDTPEADWATYTSGPTDSQDDYHSPAASFLASQEFEDHPNNPEGRRVFSNGNDEHLNHVDVNLLSEDELEVFFYVREANNSAPDDFNAIYRFVYDISDDDFQNWTMARDEAGQVIFEVVITPEAITAAVIAEQGSNFDAELYADPISLGDTEISIDDDGAKYLFFSYVSPEHGGTQGEGQITGVRLIAPSFLLGDVNRDGLVNFLDISPFIELFSTADSQVEADINQDGEVNFLDISLFIGLLGDG